MTDPKTVTESFIKWLEDNGYGVFGETIYSNHIPLEAPDDCWVVITDGGNAPIRLVTGEVEKTYLIQVRYRSASNMKVDRTLFVLEEVLNSKECFELEGFDIRRISTSQFASSQDLDEVELRTGLLAVNVQLYRAPNESPNIES